MLQLSPDTLEVRAGAISHVRRTVVMEGLCGDVSEFEQKNDNDKPKQVAETSKVGPPKKKILRLIEKRDCI